jgi:hypothetical protein
MNTADKPAIVAHPSSPAETAALEQVAAAAASIAASAAARATKSGVKTTEFWGSIVAAALPWISSAVPGSVRVIVSAAVAVAYTIGRAIVKARR